MEHHALKNSHYIQQLNQNCITLDKNIQTLEERLKQNSQNLANLVSEMARDTAAFQRALLDFLKEKDIIADEIDIKELQKLHLRYIAKIDQEVTERKDNFNKEI